MLSCLSSCHVVVVVVVDIIVLVVGGCGSLNRVLESPLPEKQRRGQDGSRKARCC